MQGFIQSVGGFLLTLVPLVIFHEFGHFIFAKIFGVKAEVFSIGFGPKIFGKTIGETEWRFSAIPLGGYVKLLGEDPERELNAEEKKRCLQAKEPWKRFFIFFGGPLFNFILAVFLFATILVLGEPQIAAVAGRVVQGSPAEVAGLRSGDEFVKIDGKPVTRFEEILEAIAEHPKGSVQAKIKRPTAGVAGKTFENLTVTLNPEVQDGFSVYGEAQHIGEVKGLLAYPRGVTIGVSSSQSVAAKVGLKTGDQVIEWNGHPIKSWEEAELLDRSQEFPQQVKLKITRTVEGKAETLDFNLSGVKKENASARFGLHSSELFIDQVVKGSPAEKAGIQKGDRIVRVGSEVVQSFFDMKDAIQRAGEKVGSAQIEWERDGRLMTATIVPTATKTRDALLRKTVIYTVGVVPLVSMGEARMVVERVLNPFTLLWRASEKTVVLSWRNLVSIGKMFTGDVSVKTLGGPILIGKIAGESVSRGLIAVLTTMAILSVGLGVLNLLPVPILDGGHLVMLGLEIVRGKPLTLRQMEILQQVGLTLILALMVVVMSNDISRLPIFN